MKMIRLVIAALLMVSVLSVSAQSEGINFEKVANWQQLMVKAKAAHKAIFLDCYASWCAPCKWMDANVYASAGVGKVYNDRFICVRVQMDKTPKDSQEVKDQYGLAEYLEKDYRVNVYPTYLFFDENGKPLHKATGSMDAKAFIQLALDAMAPEKQYYAVLRNFVPSKLDTTEEKGLADAFNSTDKVLAAKIAYDYLSRVPQQNLATPAHIRWLENFQKDSAVLSIAAKYLDHHELADNLPIIKAVGQQPAIKQLALAYIAQIKATEVGADKNNKLMRQYYKEPGVRRLANAYIEQAPEDSLFTKERLTFLYFFTKKLENRGFTIFLKKQSRVNQIMNNRHYAEQRVLIPVINDAEFVPLFQQAKINNAVPPFDSIKSVITKKYNANIAKKIEARDKLSWYNYLVNTKKQPQYWPELIDNWILNIRFSGADTMEMSQFSVNNICYAWVFLHSDQSRQLKAAYGLMKNVLLRYNDDTASRDTYACLLYKAGKTNGAIDQESEAANQAMQHKDQKNAAQFNRTIDKMKKGEKIWLEKEYQVN